MQLELILSSATVVVALYSLVAGIFGMNLPYSWNHDHSYVFKWVFAKSSSFDHFCSGGRTHEFCHTMAFVYVQLIYLRLLPSFVVF